MTFTLPAVASKVDVRVTDTWVALTKRVGSAVAPQKTLVPEDVKPVPVTVRVRPEVPAGVEV